MYITRSWRYPFCQERPRLFWRLASSTTSRLISCCVHYLHGTLLLPRSAWLRRLLFLQSHHPFIESSFVKTGRNVHMIAIEGFKFRYSHSVLSASVGLLRMLLSQTATEQYPPLQRWRSLVRLSGISIFFVKYPNRRGKSEQEKGEEDIHQFVLFRSWQYIDLTLCDQMSNIEDSRQYSKLLRCLQHKLLA